jgi:type II secretory pathway pseudopilin PulG
MSIRTNKDGGFLIAEMVMAFAILGILTVGLAVSLNAFSRFNGYQMVRQRCIAAGVAQLESISVTGEPIEDEDFKRLWPGIDVSFEKSGGTGQWQGTELLKVTTSGKSYRRKVEVQLSRYILTAKAR